MVTADTFIRIAKAIVRRVKEHTSLDREFRELFGVSPSVCLDIWNRSQMGNTLEPKVPCRIRAPPRRRSECLLGVLQELLYYFYSTVV